MMWFRSLFSASSALVPVSTPIRRMRSPCCAHTVNGHAAAAPLISLTNSRRLIAFPEAQTQHRNGSFEQGLQQLGWMPGVIVSTGSFSTGNLLRVTHTVPVVFAVVPDPVGSGFVDSLSQPGRNATGFMQFEYGFSGKWLELLKEIAPNLTRAIVLWDPAITAGIGQFAIIQSVATPAGVDLRPFNLSDAGEVERAITDFARTPNGGLIVTASALTTVRRDLIVALAARHKLATVYFERHFVAAGGLISYGANFVDQHRRAAGNVDRILKGEKPADLPVQAPTKYELVVNLKTAKTLGLTIPPSVLARADEVIE